jgi:hypothetical protein
MMKSLPMTTLQQLETRLHEQTLDVTHLRAALDLQMNRISHMYDHDALWHAGERCQFQRPRMRGTSAVASAAVGNSKEK